VMHVIFNDDLQAKLHVVKGRDDQQQQQNSIDRLLQPRDGIAVTGAGKLDQRDREPEAERDESHGGDALHPPMMGAVPGGS